MKLAATAEQARKRPSLLRFSLWRVSHGLPASRQGQVQTETMPTACADSSGFAAEMSRIAYSETTPDAQRCPTDWRGIVSSAADLAPSPAVAERVLEVMEQSDSTIGRLIEIIICDPALVARIMKAANSAIYGRQRVISSISEAIMVAGIPAIRGICLGACLKHGRNAWSEAEQMVWEHSLCTALACRNLAGKLRKTYGDELYTAGILHDLGKLILLRQIPTTYREVVNETTSGRSYLEAEGEILGYGHALISALALDKWNLPEELCQILVCHHGPEISVLDNLVYEKLNVLRFCDLLAHSLGYGHLPGYPDITAQLYRAGKKLALSERDTELLRAEAQQSHAGAVSLSSSGSRWHAVLEKKPRQRKRSRTNSGFFLVRQWARTEQP